ncbi:glycine receptor subunit alpha-2-like [Amphibalanus amphitrite]|uniref:glycine receptor subunit alpha-2-like n=1 Tax=Amphibalanus amphitrite TaxID=1232801 RepID=UPI001C926EA2|nr:glycine receptor subunit alpha-2-like [Amphibalanus amphitrite]
MVKEIALFGRRGSELVGASLPLPWLRTSTEGSETRPALQTRVRRNHAEEVCERERFGAPCDESAGPPPVQDSNVVMVGGSESATISALRRCGRQLRFKVRDLAAIPAVLYRFRDHSALYQLLVYVSSDGGAAVGRQLQKTLRAMAELFGGYSLVYLPEPVPSQLTALAYEFCQHGAGPCRWTDDLTPLLAAASRLTRNAQLLNAYDAGVSGGGETCSVPSPADPEASHTLLQQLEQLAELWCRGRWHTVLEIVLPSDRPALQPTKPQGKSSNSLGISDILPLNMKLYDKNQPPKYRGEPTTVYFHVTVISLDSINEESMTYVADVFLAQSWRDHRLRLPENMTEEYRILDVNWLLNIWRPDCIFKNAKKVTFHEMSVPNHYLWLYKDKTLLYMSKLTLVLSCAMKFEAYPHDTQSCSMMIESLSHTTYDLIFKWNLTDPLMVNPEIELPQLDISKNSTEDCTLAYSTGNFTCLAVVFHLRRRLGYHLFHTYIPSALIVVMSWISFWIKPEAIPARVTLGVTSLLTLATQNQQSQQSLPPVSYVKAIDVWMSSCSVFVFSSLMEFAIVNNFMGPVATKAMKGYSDEDLTNIDDKSLRSSVGRSRRLFSGGPARTPPLQPQYVTFCHGREVALYIDKLSRYCFPLAFVILNVVYWTCYVDWEELSQA